MMTDQPQITWKCTKCGYTYEAPQAAETCPSCREKCEFVDVSCYTPDCKGPGQDTRLV
jgi:rubredoxin